jgi:hypothetical protein
MIAERTHQNTTTYVTFRHNAGLFVSTEEDYRKSLRSTEKQRTTFNSMIKVFQESSVSIPVNSGLFTVPSRSKKEKDRNKKCVHKGSIL